MEHPHDNLNNTSDQEMILIDQEMMSSNSSIPTSSLKRKICLDSSEDVYDVVQRIKRIRFPLYLQVKTITGRLLELYLDCNDTLEQLKDLIMEKEGIPKQQQKLVYDGKTITDSQLALSMTNFGIYDRSVIYLIAALPHNQGYPGVSSEHRVDT